MMEHPLILEAMTLRGLGSYLHGARLEIRPLTILCGTNGSGKSTWFRMLKILKNSIESGKLPFSFEDDIGCGEGESHDYTNPLTRRFLAMRNVSSQQRKTVISAHWERLVCTWQPASPSIFQRRQLTTKILRPRLCCQSPCRTRSWPTGIAQREQDFEFE